MIRRGTLAALLLAACGGDTSYFVGFPEPPIPIPPPILPSPPPAPVGEWSPSNTYTQFNGPVEGTYAGLTWTMKPIQSPAESLHEKGFLHYYAVQFEVGGNTGYAGLQTDGAWYRERLGPAVNFSIRNAVSYDSASGAARRELVNRETGDPRIMLPFELEDGEEYRFTLTAAPHEGGYAWRLAVNGTLLARFLGDATFYPLGPDPIAWGEDLHWSHTHSGAAAYECEEMEPSSLQYLHVRLLDEAGEEHAATLTRSWISADTSETVTHENGHTTRLCTSPTVEDVEGGVQQNLGRPP